MEINVFRGGITELGSATHTLWEWDVYGIFQYLCPHKKHYSMPLEIERKFLVRSDAYKAEAFQHYEMMQGYIASGNGRTVRIRITNDKGFITIKGASADGGLSRYEWEKEIELKDALDLLKLCKPGIIHKTRYEVKADDLIIEVDEFYGDNQGLVIAEIELPHPDAPYQSPEWLGKEVTGIRKYYNAYLRKYPYKSW